MTNTIRLRTGLGTILALGAALGLAGFLINRPSAEYRAGFAQGAKEAEMQLNIGVASFYVDNRLLFSEIQNLDHDSGLPYEAIAADRVGERSVADSISGRVAGHNARIMRAIEAKKIPANSLLPWMKELDDVADAYARLARTNPPVRLIAGGADLVSPDGSVVLQAVAIEPNPGRSAKRVGLARKGESQASQVLEIPDDRGETELLWGPTGSSLAFIKYGGPQERAVFLAVDTRLLNWIKREMINNHQFKRHGFKVSPPLGNKLRSAEDY